MLTPALQVCTQNVNSITNSSMMYASLVQSKRLKNNAFCTVSLWMHVLIKEQLAFAQKTLKVPHTSYFLDDDCALLVSKIRFAMLPAIATEDKISENQWVFKFLNGSPDNLDDKVSFLPFDEKELTK